MTAIVTAYCACQLCCGHYAGSPTASGAMPKQGVTIAAPRHIPFGTKVNVSGLGTFTVQDRTAVRFDGRFDVFMTNHQAAIKFGKQRRQIQIIK